MKNIIATLLALTILQSCSKKNIDMNLLGDWSSTKSSNIVDLHFYKDSLIYNAWERTTKFSWKSDISKIYYKQLTNIDTKLETDFIMEYRLSLEKDTLFIKISDSIFTNEFIRTSSRRN
jgi:hypothetical protein